jgi:hypothetical protein
MADSSEAADRELEEIVAYLDGELSAEECVRVERQLASDEQFRQRLQSIERAWAALDELPLATVDDRFSRTTMQLAVQAAAADVEAKTVAMPVLRRRSRAGAALSAVAALAIGYLAFRLAWHDPNRLLLADLPVIQNVDVYSQFEDVDFLRALDREVGERLRPLVGDASELAARADSLHAVTAVDGRSDWLAALDDEQKIDLRAKLNRFRELPDEEKARLRALHDEIAAADDRAALERTMLLYEDWLDGVPPAQQFELRQMSTGERIRAIKARLEQMRVDASLTLTEPELRQLFRGIRTTMEKRNPAGPPGPPGPRERSGDRRREGGDPRDGRPGGPDRDGRDGRRDRPGNRDDDFRGGGYSQFQQMMAPQFAAGLQPGEFLDAVLAALPERTRPRFQKLSPREKFEQIMTWRRQALAMAGEISQQELEEFFAEELDAQTRAHLLSLPPGEMEQALRRRYGRHPQWGGPWGGPRGEHGMAPGRRPREEGPGGERERRRPPGEFEGPDDRRRQPPVGPPPFERFPGRPGPGEPRPDDEPRPDLEPAPPSV